MKHTALRILSMLLVVMMVATSVTVALPVSAAGSTIYVSPTGNDAGNGSASSPYKTLPKARDAARTLTKPVTVILKPGDYYLTSSLQFNSQDSNVTYKAETAGTVNIYGATRVDPSKITDADASMKSRLIDANAKQKLMVMDLSSYFSTSIPKFYSYGNSGAINQYEFAVYCGDTALSRSRWPNATESMPYIKTTGKPSFTSTSAGSKYTFTVPSYVSTRMAKWQANTNLYVNGYWGYEYNCEAARVASFSGSTFSAIGGINAGDWKTCSTQSARRVYFFNLPEEIDQPGESYVDFTAKKVYFYPPANFNKNSVYFSTITDALFAFIGTTDITLDGLNFMYCRRNAIDVRSANTSSSAIEDGTRRNFTIRNCTIAHTSWTGITFYGVGLTVDSCRIYDTGSGGISVVGGVRKSLTSGQCVIKNTIIRDFNRNERTYNPGIGMASIGGVITNCTISGGIHEGIAISANDVVVSNCVLHDLVTETSDMGAVYYGRDPSVLGIKITNNLFYNIGNDYGFTGQQSIYMDDGAMGAHITGNVFVNGTGRNSAEPGAVKAHGAQFAYIANNVFADLDGKADSYAFTDAAWGTSDGKQAEWVKYLFNQGSHTFSPEIRKKLTDVDFTSATWKNKYNGTIWANLYKYAENLATGLANPPVKSNVVKDNIMIGLNANCYSLWKNPNYTESGNATVASSIFTKPSISANSQKSDFVITTAGNSTIKSKIPSFPTLNVASWGSNLPDVDPQPQTCTHSLVAHAAVTATCLQAGNKAYWTCSKCGRYFLDSVGTSETSASAVTIAQLSHSYSQSWTTDASAHWHVCSTCSTKGSYGAHTFVNGKCSTCGYVNHTHSLQAIPAKSASCTEAGNYPYYSCTICQAVFLNAAGTAESTLANVTIPKTAHNYSTDWRFDATAHYHACTACGAQKDYAVHTMSGTKCTACGYTTHTHAIVSVAAKTATCKEAGCYAHYECSICHMTFLDASGKMEVDPSVVAIAKTAHKYGDSYKTDANNHWLECTVCFEKSNIGAHTMSGGKCSTCGYTLHTHNIVSVAAKTATCNEAGCYAHYECTSCHAIFLDAAGKMETDASTVTIAKLQNHTFSKAWQSDDSGHYHVCTACGAKGTTESHKMVDGKCTTCGYSSGGDIEKVPNDFTGDGAVDSDDVIYLLSYTMRPDLFPIQSGISVDYNGDGSTDSDDAVYLLNYLMRPDLFPLKNS